MFTNINMVASYISLRPILSYLSCPLNNQVGSYYNFKENHNIYAQICISLPQNFAGSSIPLALCLSKTKNADVI